MDLSQYSRKRMLAAPMALGALACTVAVAALGTAQAQPTPIQHVVVLYMENHALDNTSQSVHKRTEA
jgi:phospholipase C